VPLAERRPRTGAWHALVSTRSGGVVTSVMSERLACMADALPESTMAALDDPFAQLSGPLASTTRLNLSVVDSARLTPHMQRLRLTAPELDSFEYLPGQDVMLLVAAEGNRPVRRRYTIRELDAAARLLTLDIVLHGDGPGERWVRSARPGDRIEGIGPRGKITTSAGADWHLFLGDESALPAIFVMAETLPADSLATLVLEIPEEGDEQELSSAAATRISWLHRLGDPAGDPAALAAEAAEVELPPGRGHAYLFGEAKVVSRLRDILTERGLSQDQMSPKAYWGRGRANASHGEPARDG
jgi:NADPH-dependent ferric siderophore reductase